MRETEWGNERWCPACGNPTIGGFCQNCHNANMKDAERKAAERRQEAQARKAREQQAKEAKRRAAEEKEVARLRKKEVKKNEAAAAKAAAAGKTSKPAKPNDPSTFKFASLIFALAATWFLVVHALPTVGLLQDQSELLVAGGIFVASLLIGQMSPTVRKLTWFGVAGIVAYFAYKAYSGTP
ncbi:hypothetical protein [Litorimonas sp. WD9-15]|uniref:hypothetical protein n=1 Tax=Litorimonas sp. WD9-15 TaxID=3418716 RepID=UPI003CFBDAA0